MRKTSDNSASLTRADALAYLRRFPAQGRAAIALNLALVVAGNAVVLWFLVDGRMHAAHLIALLMAETILLGFIAWIEQRLVPRRDWAEQPKPWREKAPVIVFVLVWIGMAYAISLAAIEGYGDFLPLLRSWRAWREAGLQWPLFATLTMAFAHAQGDLRWYRRFGGPFQSSVGYDMAARYLTLVLGAIPFAMPFFVVTIGGFKSVEYIARKARVAPQQSIIAGAAMLGVMYGSFALISLLIDSGVAGWAIGFVLAKLIAEIFVACIPLVMAYVARHGSVKNAAASGAAQA